MSKAKFVTERCFGKWVKQFNARIEEIDELLRVLRDRITRLESHVPECPATEGNHAKKSG